MKGKKFIILGLGAVGGFISASGLFIYAILKSDKMRQTLCQITADKVNRWVFGEAKKSCYGDRVSYHDFYRSKTGFYRNVDEFIFDTYEDAENTLGELSKIAESYGVAKIADYYDLICGKSERGYYEDNCYGWTVSDLQQASIKQVETGFGKEDESSFILDLPKAYRF